MEQEVRNVTAEIMDPEKTPDQNPNQTPENPDHDSPDNLADTLGTPEEKLEKNLHEKNGLMDLMSEAPTFLFAVLRLQKEAPEFLDLDEQTAKIQFRKSLTINVLRLRMSLWQEYENARNRNRKMRATQIYAGVCNQQTWARCLSDNERLAFIVCPPSDYLVVLKEAHSAGLDTLREIVSAKVVDDEGYLLPKAADAVIKAFALLDMRLKGAVIQRVDSRVLSKSENINVNMPGNHPSLGSGLPQDMDELDRQLAIARETVRKLTEPRHPSPAQIDQMRKDVQVPTIHSQDETDIIKHGKVYAK